MKVVKTLILSLQLKLQENKVSWVEDKPELWHELNEVKHNFILNGSINSSQTRGPTILI
jgi:hypothetical protein